MAIVNTVLNYSPAPQTNFSDTAAIPVTGVETTLITFGHFSPAGSLFTEINATIGWEATSLAAETTLEFRIYQNGALVATADDTADIVVGLGLGDNVLSTFKVILPAPAGHNVYDLRVAAETGTADIEGPLVISAVTYGTP